VFFLQEEMEGLLLAVRDVDLGKGPAAAAASAAAAAAADEEVGQVQALLASLGTAPSFSTAAAGSGSTQAASSSAVGSSQQAALQAAAGQLLPSERKANQSRKEFTKVGG
jgi:hypothetical protein